MNRSTPFRCLLVLIAAGSLGFSGGLTVAKSEGALSRASFSAEGWKDQEAYEQGLRGAIDKASIKSFHERLADEPHRAGTRRGRKTGEWIMDQFATFGLESSLEEFEVLLAEPIDAALEIVSPEPMTLSIRERVLDEDPASGIADREFGWNAFSGTGDVTGRVVYANYGRKEDFDALAGMGVDLHGAIVLARYGGNFRGFKAKFAEEAGAAGLIIYSDPQDVGGGAAYPEGIWANGSTIQRGTILNLETPGDPLTPGWPSTRATKRLDVEEVGLPKIPVQPVGWDSAREILSRMRGAPAPEDWKGGLDAPYAITGGDELRVRVKVAQSRARTTIVDPIGMLRGEEEPDKLIIIGCHHDAWVYGAFDPASGLAVEMELARVFGEAAKNGHRPKRSIMFVAWDAEEFGLMGSTEWVEHHEGELTRHAVAYFNLDAAVSGSNFGASAWPSLKTLIAEAAGAVPSVDLEHANDGSPTVLDEWLSEGQTQGGADNAKVPAVGDLGGGSDHVAFLFHLGVPSASMGVNGMPAANYHSLYDSLYWYQTFVLPDYEPAAKLARVMAVEVARLANADLLPMDHGRTFADFRDRLGALGEYAQAQGVTFDPKPLSDRAEFLETRWTQAIGVVRKAFAEGTIDETKRESINGLLLVLDRAWTTPEKASGGLWHRNLYVGPDEYSGYASWSLPPLRRAIEAQDEMGIRKATAQYNKAFDQVAALLLALELAARPG